MTPWTAAHQAPLSTGVIQVRILEWACPPSRDLPNPEIDPRFPILLMDSLPSEPRGKPNSVRGFLFSFILPNTCFLSDHSHIGVRFYFIIVLIYIHGVAKSWTRLSDWTELMIDDVEHLFMCLMIICMFLGKMFIQKLCPCFKSVVCCCCFFVLSCMSSLYILNINPLLDISFAIIFFHSAFFILLILTVSLAVQSFPV